MERAALDLQVGDFGWDSGSTAIWSMLAVKVKFEFEFEFN
jgi:hypothetical protein